MEQPKQDHIAFVAVGSNIEPEKNIPAALVLLQQKLHVVASSTFYLTRPLGPPSQPAFVNGIWQIETSLQPRKARDILRRVERSLGRIRTEDKYAPRTIDLDLILHGCFMGIFPDLNLPHPDLARPFVYVPILELIGNIPYRASLFKGPITQFLSQKGIEITSKALTPGKILEQLTHQLRTLLSEK
ncbi:MAG: 2-amino-4-hydroxy-6-hydroxymethyldihydropteridine diphosphokinase [Sedimentisphaerales bacterium]|nr:2-amino-4-hydroxy-6-hydroxymethyldihydropteridine diphosphokinase [Sedimentisphaerales bacterium]